MDRPATQPAESTGRTKPVIGLSGGIGAGKSTVAAEFARLGALVIDSDELNHRVLDQPEVRAALVQWWGPDVLVRTADGAERVNRREIAARIFSQPEGRRRLEGLTYPLIAALRQDIISGGNKNPAVTIIVLDSPLLFESSLDRSCDAVVFVAASPEQRLARVVRTRGWDRDELERRERWQLPPDEKQARSTYVIPNEGDLPALRERVRAVFEQIMRNQHAA